MYSSQLLYKYFIDIQSKIDKYQEKIYKSINNKYFDIKFFEIQEL